MEELALSLPDCKEYLRKVKDLEIMCYQQKKLIQNIKNHYAATQKEVARLRGIQEEKTPVAPESSAKAMAGAAVFSPVVALIGAAIGTVVGIAIKIICALFFNLFSSWKPFLLWGAIIGAVVFCLLFATSIKDDATQKNNAYPKQLEDFRKRQEQAKLSAEKKSNELRYVLPKYLAESEDRYRETTAALQKFYDLGIIYPKYRGLVPVCTIYEYLESGRCFTLTGHEGAYNLYEDELFKHEVVGKLDDIIDRLDEISYNQNLLRRELQQSNAQINRIAQTLSNVEHNTALTSYYSQITASNTTYLTWLQSFNYDRQTKAMRELNLL